MKLRNRIVSLTLSLILIVSLLPQTVQAAAYMDSGSSSLPKLSKEEIAELVKVEAIAGADQPYSVTPGVAAPYSLGSVKQEILQAGLDRLNNLRRIAGLPAVTLDSNYTALAQAASVVNAANNAMSHNPSMPAGMDSSLYQQGQEGASSSNIACYMGWFPENGPIAFSVDMWMEDSDINNVSRLSHRRWQLNPTMGKTGFGAASTSNGWVHTAEYSFDRSASAPDYDFIAWPASGYFPNSVFGGDYAWSVTVNPDKYASPSGISVSLRRESDGKTWSFQGSGYTAANSGAYFNVETGYYGINNCIIFRPDGVETYEGVYTVSISGLRTNGGAAAELSYQVEFFDPEASTSAEPETPAAPTNPTVPVVPTVTEIPFSDVVESSWYRSYVQSAYEAGLMAGSNGQFNPSGTLSLAEAVTLAARMYAANHNETVPSSGGVWYQGAYDYCVVRGLIDTESFPLSAMTRPATRFEMVGILNGAIPAGRMVTVVSSPVIPDLRMNDPYAQIVYQWYEAGILAGGSDGSFNGSSNITRAEVAKILCEIYNLA